MHDFASKHAVQRIKSRYGLELMNLEWLYLACEVLSRSTCDPCLAAVEPYGQEIHYLQIRNEWIRAVFSRHSYQFVTILPRY